MPDSITEDQVLGVVAKVGARVVTGIWAVAVIMVVGAFGLGAFFATTNAQLGELPQIKGELVKLNERMFDLEKRVPREIPPAWFLERVGKLEARMEAIEHENGH